MSNKPETFKCNQCGHTLTMEYQVRTLGYCYLCDPMITLDECLSDKELKSEITHAPHTEFGKTKVVPLEVYLNGEKTITSMWDETWWIERGEEMYGLSASNANGKRIRIVNADVWRKAKDI